MTLKDSAMSNMNTSGVSRLQIRSAPEVANTPAPSANVNGACPRLRTESRGGPDSSLFAQEKQSEPLGNTIRKAFQAKSAEAMHKALLNAVLTQHYAGFSALANRFFVSPLTGSAKLLFDKAINMRAGNGHTILQAAMLESAKLGDSPSLQKTHAVRIINIVKRLGMSGR
jgi:hypothetical protein